MDLYPILSRLLGLIPGLGLLLSSVALFAQEPHRLTVLLRDNSEFTATTEQRGVALHTRFGSLQIPFRQISQVEFRHPLTGLDRVWTHNQNRLSGLIHQGFPLHLADGSTRSLSATELKQISQDSEGPRNTSSSTAQYVIMREGDLFSGRLLGDAIGLRRQGRLEDVPWSALESIQFTSPPGEVLVLFRDGQQDTREMNRSELRLQLAWGDELILSSWDVRSIYCRPGFVPTPVRELFDPAVEQSPSKPDQHVPFEGFVWIPPGQFLLGSDTNETGRGSDEGPQTLVSISKGFWMSQTEVTQEAYSQLMGTNPSNFSSHSQQPVEKVSWHEAVAYCRQLTLNSEDAGTLPTAYVFRLPTEAEWEYACRAGSSTRFAYGDDPHESQLGRFAWFVENSDSSPHPVAQLEPNAWGLYDMHGNVWEWCSDQWQYAYPGGKKEDYQAPDEGWLRVARGGSWLYSASHCRSANRDDYGPNNRCSDIGFRVVLARPLK